MMLTQVRRQLSLLSLSIFLTVAFPFTVAAQNQCRRLFEVIDTPEAAQAYLSSRFGSLHKPLMTPHFESPARLVLTKFGAHKDFHSSNSFSWNFNGKNFTADESRQTIQIGFRADESILADQQDFSLGKMVETDYLKPNEAAQFRADALKRETGQISFLEVVHDATDAELKRTYGDDPQLKFGGSHTFGARHDFKTRPVKTAALYNVSGQVWDKASPTRQLSLPWENEPSRAGQALDRKKYKYVWEWGRAAQDTPGEIAPLYAASAFLNYVELRAHGGHLDDAYVMVHSFDKVNTRLYSRMHPNTIYPAGWSNAADALFLVPLRDALEKYPASAVSEHVGEIMRLSGGKLTNKQAIDLLIDNKLWRWNELDFHFHGHIQSSPIILHDLSSARTGFMMLALQRLKLNDEVCGSIVDYLLNINPVLHAGNLDSKYQHAADSVFTGHHYAEANAIEISNLNPQLAKLDPNYTASVLVSAFQYYFDQMAHATSQTNHLSLEDADQHVAEYLRNNPIEFGITTSSPEIERQIAHLKPAHTAFQEGTDTSFVQPDKKMLESEPYAYRDSRLYFFTAEQIHSMIVKHPEFSDKYGGALRPGTWRTQFLSSQTDLL